MLKKKLFWLFPILLSFLLTGIFISGEINNWIIENNKVFIDDSKVYISAEPHTILSSGWVYFNITSKVYSGDIDLVVGVDTEKFKPKKAEYYKIHNVSVYEPNCSIINTTNSSCNGYYFNITEDWMDISGAFDSINYNYQGMNKWFYKKNIPIESGKNYVFRIYFDVLDTKNIKKKYWFALKPSNEGIALAIANNHLYALDPWYVSNYDWNDDCEDAIINDTYWRNYTDDLNSGGGGLVLLEEISSSDGYIKMHTQANGIGGNTYQGIAVIRTETDYKTGINYNFTFTINSSAGFAGYSQVQVEMSDGTILDEWAYSDEPTGVIKISDFLTDSTKRNYTLSLFSNGSTILFNDSFNVVATRNVSSFNNWYIQFRSAVGSTSSTSNLLEIFNFTSKPIVDTVNLISPLNNTNNTNPLSFNCSYISSSSIGNVSLYGNWSGWHLNLTNNVNGFVNSTNFSVSISDGYYIWNCLYTQNATTQKTFGTNNFSLLVDSTYPNLTIIHPNQTYTGITNIPLNYTVQDNLGISTCWYNVTIGANLDVANTIISNCSNTTFIVNFGDGNYIVHMCVNDTSNNKNCTDSSFTLENYVAPTLLGGGGTTTTIKLEQGNFSLVSGISKTLDILLAKDSTVSRTKTIKLINKGRDSFKAKLTCDTTDLEKNQTINPNNINICDYVSFEKKEVDVSSNEDSPTEIKIFVLTPENSSFGDKYSFNILAERTESNKVSYSKLSVTARVTFFGLIYKYSYFPFQSETKIDRSSYPVFWISLFLSFTSFGLIIAIFRKKFLITGFLFGSLSFFLIFILTILYF